MGRPKKTPETATAAIKAPDAPLVLGTSAPVEYLASAVVGPDNVFYEAGTLAQGLPTALCDRFRESGLLVRATNPETDEPNDGEPNDGEPNDGEPNDGEPNDGEPNDDPQTKVQQL